ncbi:microtubule-associated protein futsch-like [Scyliorhinus canicula]|uniref:microtubule-associated protein futsch-like n=1 Tax=Scyliorhinus canicula TaxID=7830 RepID=UPI0018F725BF|nr:microtubule-associated protein futsch-like [Scyliorhinus canicula]
MDKLLLPYARNRSRSTILSRSSSFTNKPSSASSEILDVSASQMRTPERSFHSLILTGASSRRATTSGSRYVSTPGHPSKTPAHGAKQAGLLKRFMGVPKDIAEESATDASQAHLTAVDEPVGCVAFYIKHCKDLSNTLVLKKRMQLVIRISVGNIMKSTATHHIRELLKIKKSKILIPFEEVKYFCVQVPRGKNDDRNKISIELLELERLSESQRVLGRTYLHLFDIVQQVSVSDTFELGIKNLHVCNLDMSIDFAYGYFGYGFSNQLKQPENEKQKIQEKSLFLRIPPLENRKDNVHNVITYQPMPYPAFLPDDLQVTVGRDRERESVLTETSEELKKVPRKVLQLMKSRKRLDQLRFEYNEKKTEEQRIEFLEQLILKKVGKSRKMLRSERKMKGAVWAGPGERSTSPKTQPESTYNYGMIHPEKEVIEASSGDFNGSTSESQDLVGHLVDILSVKGTTDQRLAALSRSASRKSSILPLKPDIFQDESHDVPDYRPMNVASVVTLYRPFIKFLNLIHRFSNRVLGVAEEPQVVDGTANLESVPGSPDGSAKSQEQDLETTLAAPSPESDLPSPEITKPESEEQDMLAANQLDGHSDLENMPSMFSSPEATLPESEQDNLKQNRKAEELHTENITQSMPSMHPIPYPPEISHDLLSILRKEDGMFSRSTEFEEVTTSFLTRSFPVSSPQSAKVESSEIGSQLPKMTSQEDGQQKWIPDSAESLELYMSSLTTSLVDIESQQGRFFENDLKDDGISQTIPDQNKYRKTSETPTTRLIYLPDTEIPKDSSQAQVRKLEDVQQQEVGSQNNLFKPEEPQEHQFSDSQQLSTTTPLESAKPESEDELDGNVEPSTSFFTSQKQAESDHKPIYATTTASVTTLLGSESDSENDMEELSSYQKSAKGQSSGSRQKGRYSIASMISLMTTDTETELEESSEFLPATRKSAKGQSSGSRQKGRYSIASMISLISTDTETELEEPSEFLPATQGEKEKQVDVSSLQTASAPPDSEQAAERELFMSLASYQGEKEKQVDVSSLQTVPAPPDSEQAAEREFFMSLASYQKYAGGHQSSYSKPSLSIASFLSISSDSDRDVTAENHIDASDSQKLLTAVRKLKSKAEEDEIYSSSKSEALSDEAAEISIPFVAKLVPPSASISVEISEDSDPLEERNEVRRHTLGTLYVSDSRSTLQTEKDDEEHKQTLGHKRNEVRRHSVETLYVSDSRSTLQTEMDAAEHKQTLGHKRNEVRRHSVETLYVSDSRSTLQTEMDAAEHKQTLGHKKYSSRRQKVNLSRVSPSMEAFMSPQDDAEQDKSTGVSTQPSVRQRSSRRKESSGSSSSETDRERGATFKRSKLGSTSQKYSARQPIVDLSKYGPKLRAFVRPGTDREQDETTEIPTESTDLQKYTARRPSMDLSKYGPTLTAYASPETDTDQDKTTEVSTESTVPQKYTARRPSMDLSKYGPTLTAYTSPETDTDQDKTTERSTVPQKYTARRPSIGLSKYSPTLTAFVSPETDTEQDKTTEISTESTVPLKYIARRPSMDLSKHGPTLTAYASPETDTEQDKTTEISTESTVPQKIT